MSNEETTKDCKKSVTFRDKIAYYEYDVGEDEIKERKQHFRDIVKNRRQSSRESYLNNDTYMDEQTSQNTKHNNSIGRRRVLRKTQEVKTESEQNPEISLENYKDTRKGFRRAPSFSDDDMKQFFDMSVSNIER